MDPVAICNMALGALGLNRIEALNEDDPGSSEAEECVTWYGATVRLVLSEAAWMFATGFYDLGAKVALAADEYLPPEMPVKFKLPGDVVSVRTWDDGSGDYSIKARKAGEYMISEDTDKLVVEVTRFVPDPKLWHPAFVWAVAYKLAETIAGPLTQSAKIEAKMADLFARQLARAETLDGVQGSSTQSVSFKTSTLANRR